LVLQTDQRANRDVKWARHCKADRWADV
jgi:hypothetical protein